MLLRLAYLTVTNAFAALRLLLVGDWDKDVEFLALRHQITVLERQLGAGRVKSAPEDWVFLAALLAPLPRQVLRQYEQFYNTHRAHQAMMQAAPLRAVPAPIADLGRIAHLDIRRRDRLGGVLHEYQHAA